MDESLIEKQNGNFANTVLGAVPSVVYNEDCVEALKRFSDNHWLDLIWNGVLLTIPLTIAEKR